jgi:hypothetical protein
MQELHKRVNRSEAAVHYALLRLHRLELVRYVGYAPRKPGANHIPARLVGVGPRVQRWAQQNVKEDRDE